MIINYVILSKLRLQPKRTPSSWRPTWYHLPGSISIVHTGGAHVHSTCTSSFVMFSSFQLLQRWFTAPKRCTITEAPKRKRWTWQYDRHSSNSIRASSSNRRHVERPSEDTPLHRRKYSQRVPRLTGFQALPHLHGGHSCQTAAVLGLSGWLRSLVRQRRQSATLWGPQGTAQLAAATTPQAEPLHPCVVIV